MPRKSKIEETLSPEQLQAFLDDCHRLGGGVTLAKIQSLAEERGLTISLMSARTFRDGALSEYLAELSAKSDLADQIAQAASHGQGMADAAAAQVAAGLFDLMVESRQDGGIKDPETLNTLAQAVTRLRSSDQSAAKLQADLRLRDEQIARLQRQAQESDEKRAAAKAKLTEATRKGGLTPEGLKRIEEAAALL
jgi:hypothetical protein